MKRLKRILIIACIMLFLMPSARAGSVFHSTFGSLYGSPPQIECLSSSFLLPALSQKIIFEGENQDSNLDVNAQENEDYFKQYSTQRVLLMVFVIVLVVVCVVLAFLMRAYYSKHLLNVKLTKQKHDLQIQRDELTEQRDKAEQERDRLEEEKDRLIEQNLQREERFKPGEKYILVELSDKSEEEYEEARVRFLKKLTKVIESHMDNPELTVDRIGAEMNLGRVQLYRKCKAASGVSPNELLRSIRLKKSHALLHETDMTVSEVAYSVGFSSPSYFAKCYKDQYGVNPSNYGSSSSLSGNKKKEKKR